MEHHPCNRHRSCECRGTRSGPPPKIHVLATGGTIATAQASGTSYRYKSGAFDVNSLRKIVPYLDKLTAITSEQVANIGSQAMNDEI
jgi:L-asparaginase